MADRARLVLWAGLAIGALALGRAPAVDGLANQPPRVDAGLDLTVTLPAAASLHGAVRDDGLPDPPGTLTLEWQQLSGPAPVAFVNTRTVATEATFPLPGIYVLRLQADDSHAQSVDEVLVSVRPNAPPLARSQEITTPEDTAATIQLTGIDPEAQPLTFAIDEPPAHGDLAGQPPALTYHPHPNYHGVDGFRFTVSDGRHTSRPASVGLLVTAVNDPPRARPVVAPAAGPAPLTLRVDGTASEDAEGPILRYDWRFGDDTSEHEPQTTHALREPGVYQVTLTVTDADGAAHSEQVPVRVFAAASVRLAYEAERIHLSAPVIVAKDAQASGGLYATSPKAPSRTVSAGEVSSARQGPKAGQGRMRCQLVLPTPGTFTVWARVRSTSEKASPFSVSLNAQPAVPVDAAGSAAGQWRWVQVLGGLQLEAGAHRLVVHPAEPGAGLDRLVVTDDPYFDPAWISDGDRP